MVEENSYCHRAPRVGKERWTSKGAMLSGKKKICWEVWCPSHKNMSKRKTSKAIGGLFLLIQADTYFESNFQEDTCLWHLVHAMQ
eukprot:3529589-Ditylum_brightwellii.AAC.1